MMQAEKRPASCPICGKPVDSVFKPFCSKRCADIDLHRWLNGAYVIAGQSLEDEAEEVQSERDET